ncbi:unnamed protein product [Lepeophtheirus salmonis]|uniref:(salmon louse) hypothetical protein n=1 Tax=Lepeophtheirus salmonis TaxID=72036 RepID=A0A7R8H7T4_LEPSM|nr:unnamed protein product [Lepeophtheirus salmonis]CAF2917024.1 unnamed protein product [Lepeophtheirus salmonis]
MDTLLSSVRPRSPWQNEIHQYRWWIVFPCLGNFLLYSSINNIFWPSMWNCAKVIVLNSVKAVSLHFFHAYFKVTYFKESYKQLRMNPNFEAPTVLTIGCFGIICNVICLIVLQKSELKLSVQFTTLLIVQSFFDLMYLLFSTPLFSIPMLWPSFSQKYMITFITPKILFPFVQIFVTGSTYNTIAVAVERLQSVKRLNTESHFPVKIVIIEMEAVLVQINNTGNVVADYTIYNKAVVTLRHSTSYNFTYFIYYNLIFSFIVMLIIPVISLAFLNFIIWKELKVISALKQRLGQKERSNVRATWSLIAVVVLYFVSHGLKHFCQYISGRGSHIFLAVGSSVNILLYCACDRRFFIVVQKTLRTWFIWPITIDSASNSGIEIPEKCRESPDDVLNSSDSTHFMPNRDSTSNLENDSDPAKNSVRYNREKNLSLKNTMKST